MGPDGNVQLCALIAGPSDHRADHSHLSHELDAIADEHGNLDTLSVEDGGLVAILWSTVRYVIMLALYGGFTNVIAGVFIMCGTEGIGATKSCQWPPR